VNHDEFDPSIPTAYPLFGKTNLMGDMPVRLRAEGNTLAAYGFGRQRIAVRATDIGRIQVRILRDRKSGEDAGSHLIVRGKSDQVMLWARGAWGPGLKEVCARLRLHRPDIDASRTSTRTFGPVLRHPYPVLRVRPRGWISLRLVAILVALATGALGALAGVGLSLLLPSAIGGARDLIAIALAIGGTVGGLWVFFAARSLLIGALRWAATSLRVGGPAPASRFFELDVPDRALGIIVSIAVALAIPLLLIWGPVIAINSIAHGFRDAALVSDLRQHGVATSGYVINVPVYSTDSSGNTVVTPQANLQFTQAGGGRVQEPDPAIAGWTWPMDTGDVVTVVYDPSDPARAAVQGQITGSVWHGAPAGNVVGGCLAIAIEPALIWLFYRRVTAARRKVARDFAEGLA
jgi:hypothetical protein